MLNVCLLNFLSEVKIDSKSDKLLHKIYELAYLKKVRNCPQIRQIMHNLFE